jgi:hypothetical protein
MIQLLKSNTSDIEFYEAIHKMNKEIIQCCALPKFLVGKKYNKKTAIQQIKAYQEITKNRKYRYQ